MLVHSLNPLMSQNKGASRSKRDLPFSWCIFWSFVIGQFRRVCAFSTGGGRYTTFEALPPSVSRDPGPPSQRGWGLGGASRGACLASRYCYEIIRRPVLCGREGGWNRIFLCSSRSLTPSVLTCVSGCLCLCLHVSLLSMLDRECENYAER